MSGYSSTFADALTAYRRMVDTETFDLTRFGLDPGAMYEVLSEVATTDVTPTEGYLLGFLAGFHLAQNATAQSILAMAVEELTTGPTGATGSQRPRGMGKRRMRR